MVQQTLESKSKVLILTGNEAVAYGAYLSRTQVVAAYPITPQTSIIETLAELMVNATWESRYVSVESEHSAMAACIGASLVGARTFTATSSQGLALMHELLHWASGGRLPIVMVNVNRAMAPGWNIWSDQNDTLSQRDTGWMQIYCESSQEALDSVIFAFKVAELHHIPVLVILDAFVLSHTAEPVTIPSEELVQKWLPPRKPLFALDTENPATFYGLILSEPYQKLRYQLEIDMQKALVTIKEFDKDYKRFFGRGYGVLEPYRCEDAEIILVTSGSPSSTSKIVIDYYRKRGIKIGRLKIRVFRPFPFEDIRNYLAGTKKVAVLDRNISYGHHGIFFQEIKSALYNSSVRPKLYGYISGIGGKDISVEILKKIVQLTLERETPEEESIWL